MLREFAVALHRAVARRGALPRAIVAIATCALVAACGIKGPLKLPPTTTPTTTPTPGDTTTKGAAPPSTPGAPANSNDPLPTSRP